MNTYAKHLKCLIYSLISELAESPRKFTTFDSNAFTRRSKWNLSTIMKFILNFGSKSLGTEIGDFFQYQKGFPTVSSFVQQRKKLNYTAFEQLFREFIIKVILYLNFLRDIVYLQLMGVTLVFLIIPLNQTVLKKSMFQQYT